MNPGAVGVGVGSGVGAGEANGVYVAEVYGWGRVRDSEEQCTGGRGDVSGVGMVVGCGGWHCVAVGLRVGAEFC